MGFKNIRLINIQAHKDTLYDNLPETGIISITGQNNSGKSALENVFTAIVSGSLRNKDQRYSLINFESAYGEVIFETHGGERLLAHINRELSETYIRVQTPLIDSTAYVTEPSYIDLVEAFNLHYNKDREVTLHTFHLYTQLLFINTSPALNADIISECLRDIKVEKAKDAIKALTDYSKGQVDSRMTELDNVYARMSSLALYNLEVEYTYASALEYAATMVKTLIETQHPSGDLSWYEEAPQVDDVVVASLQQCLDALPPIESIRSVPSIPVGEIVALRKVLVSLPEDQAYSSSPSTREHEISRLWKVVSTEVEDITYIASNYEKAIEDVKSFSNNICPTCGRSL